MRTLDVPQANDLDSVRAVTRAVQYGADSVEAIADFTSFSLRHAGYRVHAARVLGLLAMDGDTPRLTVDGERLLEAPLGSLAEREVYFGLIQRSPVLQVLAPDLLGPNPPRLEDLTTRLVEQTELSRSTAERRASGLLTWRRRVLDERIPDAARPPTVRSTAKAEQLDLFGG